MTGTYQWIVSYSGDGNNNPVASASGDEPVVVAPATLLLSTTINPSDVTPRMAAASDIRLGDAQGRARGNRTITFNL